MVSDCRLCKYFDPEDKTCSGGDFRPTIEAGCTLGEPTESDPVSHPNHYTQGGIECIDAIDAACTGLSDAESYYIGNTIKYLWRWKFKNGVEDLKKAKFYLERLIEKLK